MCGRYSLIEDEHGLEDRFSFRGEGLSYEPREQLYPTNDVVTVVAEDAARRGVMMHWGWLPPWAKGRAIINAQAEKVAGSNVWKRSLKSRRCLVLADGFYEWRKESDGSKTMPYS